ncbi:MAG: 16S rRNA (uracil(1498)-N(3))-methyltransferase [Nitratireductor sp.]
MERYDYTTQRLFVDAPLGDGVSVALDKGQSNYLLNVLRMKSGANVLAFNGRDGEWLCTLTGEGRKSASLKVATQTRMQPAPGTLHYLFAPLKHARLDYMVQKAVEMGAAVLQPVVTQHTQASRVNTERMQANALEAAEQCGILAVPQIREPARLETLLRAWETANDPDRRLVFCDESASDNDCLELLKPLKGRPLSVLIGPEGGFSQQEREILRGLPFVTAIPLGPRILRADTAAVAALAVVQAVAGDWS